LNVDKPIIHHGVFGAGMFQTIYSPPQVWWPLLALSLEWWLMALMLLGLAPFANPLAWLARHDILNALVDSTFANPLLLLPLAMLATTLGVAYLVAGQAAPAEHQRRWWSRWLIAAMHVAQPVERGWARYRTRFEDIRIPDAMHRLRRVWQHRGGFRLRRNQLDLWSENGVGREELLKELVDMAAQHRWFVRIDSGWRPTDVRFYGDRWCKADLVTVTENHGGGKRLTRVRLEGRATLFQKALILGLGYSVILAWAIEPRWALYVAPLILATLWQVRHTGRELRAAVIASVMTTARQMGMTVVGAPDLLAKRGEREEPATASLPVASRLIALLSWRRLSGVARRVALLLF